jgi:hypothetical protein
VAVHYADLWSGSIQLFSCQTQKSDVQRSDRDMVSGNDKGKSTCKGTTVLALEIDDLREKHFKFYVIGKENRSNQHKCPNSGKPRDIRRRLCQ